tara:strand:+ start:217 stop:2637 length:2421 start_codon:yes stop_codon:yes gene_type:complete
MQDVEIYIGDSTALSGTITYQAGNNLTDSTKNFFSNPEIVGNIIVNNTNGKRATVTGVYGDQTILLDVPISEFGANTNSYSILQNQELLDTFKDETISLTQTVKDIKDVDKIKTSFSKSFTLPASKINNRVFKHYYRQDIVGGFDARFMVSATIKLNGNKFRDGKIRLISVKMKNNLPYAYTVNFTGNTVTLKNTFGDDELTDLPYLDIFNHTYSYANVKSYMQTGYNPVGGSSTSYPELIYPFIGASNNRYYYNSGHSGEGSHDEIANVRNIYHDGTPSLSSSHSDFHSIQYFDLKPAIKVYFVLKAIEAKYGFTISDDFFRTSTTSSGKPNVDGLFDQLYMWCNKEAGSLFNLVGEQSKELKLEGITYASGTEVRTNSLTEVVLGTYIFTVAGKPYSTYRRLHYEFDTTVTGTGAYDLVLYDKVTGEIYQEKLNNVGNVSFAQRITIYEAGDHPVSPAIKVVTRSGVTQVVLTDLELRLVNEDGTSTGNYTGTLSSISGTVDFRTKILPKIKVIDFLTNLFKMFNMVAYFEGTELVVKTLDQYYLNSSNETFDIDEYVDISSSNIDRSEIYNEINYEYKEANTIFAINSNESTNDEYGNERFNSEGEKIFDGKKYDVKVGFGHMVFENLLDEDTSQFSGITWGWSVSQDVNPVIDGGTFFINNRKSLGADSDIYVTDKVVGVSGANVDELTHLYIPSNVYTETGGSEVRSTNFGSEFNEFTNTSEEDGLFKTYHQNFILNIYNPQARVLKITAHLPLKILLKYELNDRFVYQGRKYLINSITTNLQTGKSELELITDNYQAAAV